MVVRVGFDFARASLAGRTGGARARTVAYLAIGAAAAVFAGAALVLALLACGLAELAWRRRSRAAVHAWPLALVLGATGAAALPPLAWTAFKVGALSYGGGFVIIPLMQADAVDAYGWMTRSEFADAVAYGQLTPGPVVQTVAMVGWAAAGLPGALVASAVAFAPSFLVVALTGERFERLRGSGAARAFLDGAGPAAAGAVLGVAIPLVDALEEAWQYAVLGGAAVLVLTALADLGLGRAARSPGSSRRSPGSRSPPTSITARCRRRPQTSSRGSSASTPSTRPATSASVRSGSPST